MNQDRRNLLLGLARKNLDFALNQTNLTSNVRYNKVRDIYAIQDDSESLLMITTDRGTAFDRPYGLVPYKGQVLNQLSWWWFTETQDIVPNHAQNLLGSNGMIVQKCTPLLIEVVIRGYITGSTETSLWTKYALGERFIYGQEFPDHLQKNQILPVPVITLTTKGEKGKHDLPLTLAEAAEIVGAEILEKVLDIALKLFKRGQQLALKGGLILVDTKYEFGLDKNGDVVLIDEIHTPDSSRYWLRKSYAGRFAKGREPEIRDKEYIRLILSKQGYRGEGEMPKLKRTQLVNAAVFYIDAFERLTGRDFMPAPYPIELHLAEAAKRTHCVLI